MSILIKGMEMLKDGTFNIVYIYPDGHVSMPFWGKGVQRVQGINAIPVPPHGRLGDLDKLIDKLTDLEESTRRFNPPDDIHGFNNGLLCGISNVIGEIRYYTPTVIEAEGSKT